MISLFRTYTISVQDSTTFAPDNDLELLLYEGKIEIKPDVLNAGKKDVFDYGTTSKAISVCDKNGVPCTALVADAIERPGEYDFVNIDLNRVSSLSYLGETLYSVVARPDDSDPSDPFANAKIIVSETDLSDVNIKQIVRAAIGGVSSLTDNIMIAGGSVAFSQYTNGVVNHNYDQHLKITNLPSEITSLTEIATSYPTFATSTKLCLRFNVYYSNGTDVIRWEGVPCYKTSDNSWVIHLQRDQYNTYRSKEFGGGGFIDLGAIWQNFIITMDPTNNNVYFRRFDTNPTIALPTTGSSFERTMIHTHMIGTEPVVGIGAWTYATAAETPYYNLDVNGTRGARVRISTTPRLSIEPSVSKIGFNTGTHYFGSSTSASIVVLNALVKFAASTIPTSDVKIGHNVLTYPRIVLDATSVKTEGASNTYILVNTSNQLSMYQGGNLSLYVASDQTTLKYASSYTLSLNSSSAYLQGATSGQYSLYATTALSVFGHNFTVSYTQPLMVVTSTYARLQGSTTTYFSATSSNQLYAYQGSNQALAIDSTQTTLKFGAGPSYTLSLLSGSAYLQGATGSSYRWHTTPTVTAFGHDFTISYNTPLFRSLSTYVQMQSTASTYLLINDSNEVWVNVNESGTKRSIWLGATNGYYFGYNVNVPATGVYFKATSANAYIYHSAKDVFKFDGYTLTLSPGGSAVATNIQFTTSLYSVVFNGVTKFSTNSTSTDCSYATNNYIKVENDQITFGVSSTATQNVRVNKDATGNGYLKLPLCANVYPSPPFNAETGAIVFANYLVGGIYKLYVKTPIGWRYVDLL